MLYFYWNIVHINTILNLEISIVFTEIRETFALFDADESGKLSRDDVAKVVRSTGCNPTEKELLDMFQSIDSDGMESK